MGRKSREKRERRERDEGPIAAAVASFAPASLVPILDAASASPTAAHRGPSIAALFDAVVHRRKSGAAIASPGVLSELVAGVASSLPGVGAIEDFRPYDSRSEVLVRWGPSQFRLLSGSLERPTAMVDQHLLLAEAIDQTLIPRLGYGLFDVGDLLLRRVDRAANALATVWPGGPPAEVGAAPRVSQAEVNVAAALPSIEAIARECTNPSRAVAAAARYQLTQERLVCDLSHPVAMFGAAIATRVGRQTVTLPSAFLMEALPAVGAELASIASLDRSAADAYAGLAGNAIGLLFQGSRQSISGPVRAGDGHPFHSIVTFNDRQVLAIDVAAGLTGDVLQERLDAGAEALAHVQPGVEIRNPGGTWRLPPDAEIARVQVIAAPLTATTHFPSGPVMTLEDLRWIVYSAQRSPEDLWYFVRDLENPPVAGPMFAWDVIDKWEVWRPQSSFYRGGAALTGLFFSPHASIAEWEEAAASAPTERALYALDLPPLRHWPLKDIRHHHESEVADLHKDVVYQVMSWSTPVAISKTDPAGPREPSSTLWNLADGIAWKLERSIDAFLAAAKQSSLQSLRITFEHHERDSGSPLTYEGFTDNTLTIGWDGRLQDALLNNSFAVESLCGEILAQAFEPSVRDQFRAAWDAAPPGLRMDAFTVPQRAQSLPDALELHEPLRSDVLRQLGEHLSASGIGPAVLEHGDATRFESHTVFPWLVSQFHEAIASLSATELLKFAILQLEAVSHQRFISDKRLAWHQGFPVRDGWESDPREKISRATRVISFIVEEVLAHPPNGDAPVDDLAWIKALSVADLCIDSCFRSEEIHRRLTQTSIEITDMLEVTIAHSDAPTDIDLQAYNRARLAGTMPAGEPIATGQDVEPDGDGDSPVPVVERMPELTEIDDAMRASLGFGVDALTGALNVATQWDATNSAPALVVPLDVFVNACVELAVGATPDEYRVAVDWLTLHGADLASETIPHWEVERRAKRITTSPFVESQNGIWVLPWTAGSTLRIFANYLSDGRLPWPDTALPRPVTDALGRYRQQRNKDLEKDCVAALSRDGFIVRGSVKPEKADHYGITELSGEIDALCVDLARSRIWVIEAKDPYTPYSSRQIRRLIDDFNKPGKYVDRLMKKVDDVERSATSIAAVLDVPVPERTWQVQGLMVTRHPEPAAFTVNPLVPFCVIDGIVAVVDSDDAPAAGSLGSE